MSQSLFETRRRGTDRLAIFTIKALSSFAILILVVILGYIAFRGLYSSKQYESVVVPKIQSAGAPVVALVDTDNLMQRITYPDLQAWYSGKAFSLRRVSGVDSEVRLYIEQGLEASIMEYLGLDAKLLAKSNAVVATREQILAEAAQGRGGIALVSSESALGKLHGLELLHIEDMVLAVNPSVLELVGNIRLTSVPQERVADILSGTLSNWTEVGGQQLPILVVPPDDLATTPGGVALIPYAEAESNQYPTLKVNAVSHARNLRLAYLLDSPVESGKYGGISTIIGNTLLMVFFTILIAGPLGIGAAAFLVEYPHNKRLLSIIRSGVDVLAGIPSIIFGLFGLLVFVQLLGWSFSLASGSMTIAIMILPTIIRTSEEAIRSVPRSVVEASIALGATKAETIWKVILPTASPGITTGIILAIGRAVGETAALIYTIGSSTDFATGPLESARVLAMHIFLTITEGQSFDRAFASALVLVVLVLGINLLARFSARRLFKHG
ncbi:MAG: phosphate ABC transporter, permease protein PstA [Spirochaetae bacterium HGW-Spirochaetae-8]|nr:MAG: phosphate ABC transporter, permease protein PstA [Spirochaetae bacterium HGW-Spirochaetae-8]